jgi:LPS-assembly protein
MRHIPRLTETTLFFLAGLLFILPGPSLAQETQVAEVKIKYQTMERSQDRIIATGNPVEIEYRDLKLFADRVELDTKTKDVFAVGIGRDVILLLPDETISAKSIFFNLDNAKGKFEQAVGLLQPSIRYQAASIERKDENLYSFGRSEFTSCSQPVPRWKFSCARANFKKGDYMEMWGAVFSIKKVPIFYLPYMRYPLDQERATGFLMPQLGFSGAKGMFYAQDFYWAIARNMDATFSLNYYGKRGVGGGTEYRYMFSGGTGGSLNLFYFLFNKGEGTSGTAGTSPSNAYLIRWSHNQLLPFGFSLVADVDYQSSYEFLREFDNNFQRAVVSNRRSQVYLTKSWSGINLNVRASRFETNYPTSGSAGDSIVTYYLPQITLNSFKMKLFNPIYFSFSSSFNSWQYGWQSDYDAGREWRVQNLAFNPEISLPFAGIPWLTANLAVSGNMNYYWQSYKLTEAGSIVRQGGRPVTVNEPIFARNFGLSLELIGPVFYRIFGGGGGEEKSKKAPTGTQPKVSNQPPDQAGQEAGAGQAPGAESGQESTALRIKHIIEPSIAYRYESPVADRDRIIAPYGFFRYHQISYSLANRVLIKQEKMPREIFTWILRQTYYLAAEDSPNSLFLVDGKVPEFSEVSSYLRFYPAGRYSIDFTANYNPYHKTLSSIRLGAQLGTEADPMFLHVSWFKSINAWSLGGEGFNYSLWDRHQINFFGGLKIPKWSLEALGEADFNIVERKMLYLAGSVAYHYQCLDLKAEMRVYYFRDRPETQFRISFGLGNIGKSTDFLGGMGF